MEKRPVNQTASTLMALILALLLLAGAVMSQIEIEALSERIRETISQP